MPIDIGGQTYYRTMEVCREVGVSRNTLFRWLSHGVLDEPENRDRRGWRLFTGQEVDKLRMEANKVTRAGSA